MYTVKQLDRAGVSLNYIDEGNGPAVLLVHGFPDSLQLWRNQVPVLLDAGYRVIAADNRGMGNSDAPSSSAYTLDEIASDLEAILDECQVTRVAAGRYVQADWRYERVGPAGHWLMLDSPGHINRLLLNHLAQYHSAA